MRYRTAIISDESDRRYMHRNVQASLMSNSKWIKLINLLAENPQAARIADVKILNGEATFQSDLANWRIIDRKYADETSFGPPMPLVSVEWVEFKRVVKPKPYAQIPARWWEQDIETLARLLEAAGRYPVLLTNESLFLTGHLVRSG